MEKISQDQLKYVRAIIVDDDSFALRIIHHILTGLGINTIDQAFNGEEAIRLINKNEYDILITDIEMPNMNGLELVKNIRTGKTQASRSLASIVITNFSETELLGSILALDVNGFLTKPIKQVWVHEKITQAMTEGGFIQPVETYSAVETNLPGIRSTSIKTKIDISIKHKAPVEKLHSKETPTADTLDNMIFVRDLKPGMNLQKDLHLKDGTLLLKSGYRLTEATINRLHDIRNSLDSEAVAIEQKQATG